MSFARGFWPTFVVQFSGALNDNLFKNVVVLTIAFDPSMSEVRANQFVIAAGALFILPFALFSLPGGALADRVDKARLIRTLKALEVVLMAGGALALEAGHVPGMLVVTFAMGVQSAFFGPTKYAILPQHLSARVLPRVNGFFQLSTFAAILVGTVVAGLVSSLESTRETLAGMLVMAVAAVGLMAALLVPVAPPARDADGERVELKATLRRARLLPVVFAIAWLWFAAITLMGLIPGLTRDVLGGEELHVTWLLVALTVGVATGCLVFAVARDAAFERRTVAAAAVGLSLGVAGIAAVLTVVPSGAFGWTAALAVAIGTGAGVYIVPLITRLQRAADLAVRARVLALSNLTNAVFMILASAASLVAVRYLDYGTIFALLACGSAAVFASVLPFVVLDSTPARDTMST